MTKIKIKKERIKMNGKILVTLLLLASTLNSKILFNKDLKINGTLEANIGSFQDLTVQNLCNIESLLSTDTLKT